MEWIETTAKTVTDAKELALDQLHVDEADAEFEVVEEPRQGLFGRTRGEARVRARVRPVQPRPKVDRRERRRPARRKGGAERAGTSNDEPRDNKEGGSSERDDQAPQRSSERADGGGSRNRTRRRSGGKQQGAERSAQSPTGEDVPKRRQTNEESTVSDDRSNQDPGNDVTVHEQAAIVQTFVEGLVDAFGAQAEVRTVDVDDETVEVHVDGDDLGLMVGPRGATLQAIHDLSRSVVQRQATGTHHGRVRLDIAGYRERRRDALERFTQKLAEAALESGVAQVLEPMSAADRKVVHDTANSIDGVHTTSEGEDARRHVVIIPDAAS